jgi:ubiquitin-conjugating enzyme E2 variant
MHASLPQHPEISAVSRGLERGALIAAPLLALELLLMRAGAPAPCDGATVALVVAGMFAADFISGLVHWAADTWGRRDWPLLGARLIEPFRVHHVNPRDICRRDMVDLNGDVALLCLPLLAWALTLPMAGCWHAVEFVTAFVTFTLPTNLIHRWAHAGRAAPALARLLQRSGLILSPRRHHAHHRAPFDSDYCIVSGWCNPALREIRFWRALERLVAALSGATPRADDAALYKTIFGRAACGEPGPRARRSARGAPWSEDPA